MHIDSSLSIYEAAHQLGCSPQHIRRLLDTADLTGTRHDEDWCVSAASVSGYALPASKKRSDVVKDQVSSLQPDRSKLKALSFFSGAMGLDLGLEKAGIQTLLSCEFDKASRSTIRANRPEMGLIGDILDYSAKDILHFAGLKESAGIDLIVGGPPCQAFSTAGKRLGFEDHRGNVFLKYLELIETLKPKYAVIENVRGLLSSTMTIRDAFSEKLEVPIEGVPGSSLYYVLKRLEKAGYSVSFNLYNSANFGTPQVRERVVLLAVFNDRSLPHLTPTHDKLARYGLKSWLTFKDAVEDLPDSPKEYVKFRDKRLKYIEMLKPGQNWRNLPAEIQPEAMGNSYLLGGGKTGFYRRLAWDKPAPTIVTHPSMPATELAHPVENRPLSVQEYKRIQEFPDGWEICGKLTDQYKQIGNAVPVGLGKAIGLTILNHAQGKRSEEFKGFSYSRYKNTSKEDFVKAFLDRLSVQKRADKQLKLNLN